MARRLGLQGEKARKGSIRKTGLYIRVLNFTAGICRFVLLALFRFRFLFFILI